MMPDETQQYAEELINIFTPEAVTPLSKSLTERGKKTPQSDFYSVSVAIANQKLIHSKGDISEIVNDVKERNYEIIGGGYDIGISGNAQTDKLIYTLCQLLDRQERVLATPTEGAMMLFGDEAVKTAIRSTFAGAIPIIINRVVLAKTYFAKKRIGGNEVAQVTEMLFTLSNQRYLKLVEEDNKRSLILVQPVIIPNLPIYESDKSASFVVLLNTEFKRGGRYIPFPSCYLSLTQKATHLLHQLFLLLAQQASKANLAHKKNKCEYTITENNLWQIIANEPKYKGKPKKRYADFVKAVDLCKIIGLVTSYSQGKTRAGEPTAEFTLNIKYHEQEFKAVEVQD